MYYVYLLKKSDGEIYIGYTNNLERRIKEHKDKKPELIYYEAYQDRRDALACERFLKTGWVEIVSSAYYDTACKDSIQKVGREESPNTIRHHTARRGGGKR